MRRRGAGRLSLEYTYTRRPAAHAAVHPLESPRTPSLHPSPHTLLLIHNCLSRVLGYPRSIRGSPSTTPPGARTRAPPSASLQCALPQGVLLCSPSSPRVFPALRVNHPVCTTCSARHYTHKIPQFTELARAIHRPGTQPSSLPVKLHTHSHVRCTTGSFPCSASPGHCTHIVQVNPSPSLEH